MKNFLTEKMLLNTKHGSDCTLEVCTAGDPDKDTVIFKGPAGDCLRKVTTHELSFTGDQYFCLYTDQGSFDGVTFEDIAWRMGYAPDDLSEILGLGEAPEEGLETEDGQDINILSMEECLDEDYGASIVQYQKGDLISFSFSKIPVTEALSDPQKLIADVQAHYMNQQSQPLWSDLSQTLLDVVLEEPFDMYFVEYDTEGWTEEMSEVLWEEVCAQGISGAVTCGEDALVTVYAGAMGSIDWAGHPEYGKPCLEHVFENNALASAKKPSLSDQIRSAEAGCKPSTGHATTFERSAGR